MNILFPIGSFYPSQQGGPSNTVYWLAKALTAAGEEVSVVTTDFGAEGKIAPDIWLDSACGRVIYHSVWFISLPVRMLRSVGKAVPFCDIVHLSSLFYPPSLITAFMTKWNGKPLVWSPRGELDEKALIYSSWKKKPALWCIKRFLAKETVFHSTSPEETGRVRAVLGPDVQVVELPNFMEIPPRARRHSKKPYLLYIGRIHPKKALENLIAALPLSQAFMRSACSLKIAGAGDNTYGEQLKKQVAGLGLHEKVEFLGLMEGEAKQSWYAGAHFSILPSHTENFGNVVIESLAQGTPVIASKGTPWSLLETEQAGFWTDNTPAALAAVIDRALELPPEDYRMFRKNALSLVRQRFDIHGNIHKWIEIYQIIARSGNLC